nr:HlyC/CorC family transporter [Desulfobulbaceae bacterium]
MLLQLCVSAGIAIIVSALCSIAEAALYSVSHSHIELLAKSGKKSGLILKELKDDITSPITAILTLNTICNTMGAAVAGASAVALFGDSMLGVFSALFTLFILIFSEIIPKTAGVAYSRKIVTWMAYPLYFLVKVFKPFIWLCNKITRLIEKSGQKAYISSKEIKIIASMSKHSGEIDHQEEKIIVNILELRSKNVRKAMTPRTVTFTLDANLTVAEAADFKDKWNIHSRVPVYDSVPDNIVGIVLRKEVLINAADGNLDTKLSELMEAPHFVPESIPLPNVLLEFFEHRVHLFVVVDEYGGFTGIISLEDIIEEIMGEEIMDESDETRDMRALARFKKATRQNKHAIT